MKNPTLLSITAALILLGTSAYAQVDVGSFPAQYKNAAIQAWPIIEPFARSLFYLLATIQLAWAAIILALEKSDLQGWVVGLARQIFFIGLGLAILENAKNWMWALFNSFIKLGEKVTTTPLEPGDIFGMGVKIGWALSNKHVGFNIPLGIVYLICAGVIVVAFTLIAVALLLALIEGAIAVVLGQILLGFMGSKWTIGYAEKYFGMIVNVGLKVFTTYFMAALTVKITQNWVAIAESAQEISKAYELLGGAIVLCAIIWAIPKFISMIIGGAPSLGFSDTAGAVAGMATAVGTAAGATITGGLKAGSVLEKASNPSNAITAQTANSPDGQAVPPPNTQAVSQPSSSGAGSISSLPDSPHPNNDKSGHANGSKDSKSIDSSPQPSSSGEGHVSPPLNSSGSTQPPNSSPNPTANSSAISNKGNDLISSAAQGIAAQAGMSSFVPRHHSTSDGASGMPSSDAAPTTPPSLNDRGGSSATGNAPTGVNEPEKTTIPSNNSASSSISPMPSSNMVSEPINATFPSGSDVAGSEVADMTTGSSTLSVASSPPPPHPTSPPTTAAPPPSVNDDYARMDKERHARDARPNNLMRPKPLQSSAPPNLNPPKRS